MFSFDVLAIVVSFCFSGVQSWGHCSDFSLSCANWAKQGECTGENAAVVKGQCPHSCGLCPWICRDAEAACDDWAKSGQCEENKEFMFKTCPTACGICKPKCYDKDEQQCPGWARAGECKKNPAILASCSVSCGVCTSLCLDTANDCPQWAAAGHCNENPAFMLKTCPFSCNVCDVQKHGSKVCADRDREQCLIWGEQECGANPESLMRTCPSLCGVCTLACEDKNEDCANWVKTKDGKVTADSIKTACAAEFMIENCAQSCGTCQAIPSIKPPTKEEL